MVRYSFPMVIPVILERMMRFLWASFDAINTALLCWIWGVECGRKSVFSGMPYIRTRHKREIVIGRNAILESRFRANLVGLTNKCVLDTRLGGMIVLGDNSGMSATVISSKSSVQIGKNVKIGGNVRILDHDFHSLSADVRRSKYDGENARSAPIYIGDDVFIGTNAIVLKGSRIGARSIIAAGSIVFGLDVPPDSLVKGNPAIVVKTGN